MDFKTSDDMNQLNPQEHLELSNDEQVPLKRSGNTTKTVPSSAPPHLTPLSLRKPIVIGAFCLAVTLLAGFVITALYLNKRNEALDRFDQTESVFVTDSDSLGIGLIPPDVIGTGALYEDCVMYDGPSEDAQVKMSLKAGTDLLIFEITGQYYLVSTPDSIAKR